MKRPPPIAIWHNDGEAYGAALRQRLPDVEITVVDAADGPMGAAPHAVEHRCDAEVVLAWKVPAGALSTMRGLRWVQVTGAGVDHFLDRDDLPAHIALTRSLGRFGAQVAEYTVGYLLHHLLGIDRYRRRQQDRRWVREARPLLCDTTVGVVGLGSLGLPIAATLGALGATVLGVRRRATATPGVAEVFSLRNWCSMLPRCDAIVLAVPKTPETIGMLHRATIAQLPRGAVLINVARGELVDEDALCAALESRQLGAAVLDVFAHEPLPADHPLWRHPRAWVTPHIAAPSEVAVIADEFAVNYRRFVAGRELLNLVDRTRGY